MYLQANEWAEPLYRPHGELDVDYAIIRGGRGSSKTHEISQALTLKGHIEPLRIVIAREHLKSIEESAKQEIEQRAREMGLLDPRTGYKVSHTRITHVNGTRFIFHGLSKMSEEDIKGLADVDICWVEEAQKMSHSSWELLRPTIRKELSQIWASYNPRYRTDAIAAWLEKNKHNPRVLSMLINYADNDFFTERSNRDRLMCKETEPDRYLHIWEGHYDDVSAARKVLPYGLISKCVDAWDRRPQPRGAFVEAGFDVADTGADKNALAMRSGPEMFSLETWRGSEQYTISNSARRVKVSLDEVGAIRLYYDAAGVGAGVRGPMQDAGVTFGLRGAHFGGTVGAPDTPFISRGNDGPKTNKEYFQNWASQAGWALRLRAENTTKLLAGERVDPDKCLFINPDIDNLEDALAAMAQPEWNTDSGKLKIDKQPRPVGEEKPPSPDEYDAAIMAFGSDTMRMYRLLGS